MAKNRLINKHRNGFEPQLRIKERVGVKNALFLSVLVLVLITPIFAYAGLFSFISSIFQGEPENIAETTTNSQTMPLLQAAVNFDPLPLARGGGDISIVGGSALLSESGPNGSYANVDSGKNQNGRVSVYIVREGDTLSQIAEMFNVTTNTIAWNNDIERGVIRPGQTLIILPITGVQHIVVKGDTLESIAKKYKADANEIRGYNHLSPGAVLAIGSTIVVPDGEMAPVATSPVTANLRGAGGPDYSGYYTRPIIGGRKTQGLHGYNGVDLASYSGAAVMAAAGGEVIVARDWGYNGGYGSYVVITHGNGTQTLYSHLSSVIVASGQYVVQGQVIGTIGSTGRSTGPHLHFEVRGARNPF